MKARLSGGDPGVAGGSLVLYGWMANPFTTLRRNGLTIQQRFAGGDLDNIMTTHALLQRDTRLVYIKHT